MIVVAGRKITDRQALARLAKYPPCTVRGYDLPRCHPGPVTFKEVKRTRVINSRISNAEAQSLIRCSRGWNWTLIPPTAALVNADPTVSGGLWDDAVHMYDYFMTCTPSGISWGKVSKVLHLKYPSLVPILDTRLTKLYRARATAAAQGSPRWRSKFRRLWWAAIRLDLLASDFAGLRGLLARATGHPQTFVNVTDLRLLDALAW